jgi:iron complex outermembrane receptor protein
MKRVSNVTICLSWLLLWGFPPSTFAQAQQAGVGGTIYDESGAVLVGVTVTAMNLQTGSSTSVVCDDRGDYELSRLEAGDYEVQAVLPGFRNEVAGVTIAEGEIQILDFTLKIAPLSETVTVTRAEQELSAVPKAVDLVLEEEIQFAQRKVSLAEGLRSIPGVFVKNRGNFSESGGIRLSIRAPVRGIGVGTRGLQIVQDGIPLTMADGTTQPTNIDLGSTGEVELIRGPSSVLYGNSAGGVISLRTEIPSSRPLVVQPDIQIGSYGYQRQQIKATGTKGELGYLINVTRMKSEGFRDHSSAEIRQANAVIRTLLSPDTELRGVFNIFDMPFGESPSTATRTEALNNPRSVRQLAINQGFGESSTQGQGGMTVEHRFAGGQVLRSTGWAMWRDVWNPIPFRIIDLARVGAGFRSQYGGSAQLGAIPITWTTGFDASYQRDDRVERENEGVGANGFAQEGGLLVDQLERVLSVGPFAQVSLAPNPRWQVTAGVRYDYYDFDAGDHLLADGDQSGGRTLDAFSPTVGLTYTAADWLNVYGNFATAYETPTTQQLSNRPTGEGGFNPDLEPEDLQTFEAGFRGLIEGWRLRYDITGYFSTLDNAFVEFQRADEQEFFRNAGESSRNGIELLLEWQPVSRFNTRLAYTYQDFEFKRFVTDDGDFSGKLEPGAPPHQFFFGLTYETSFGLRSAAQFQWVDAYPVNNANTFSNWASTVVDLRFGLERTWNEVDILPFLGIDNLFNERYNASTVPNAFGRRFYEPSAGREFYVGVTIGVGLW